jgi:hypothetical protein
MNQIMHATARPGALLPQLFDSVLRIGFTFLYEYHCKRVHATHNNWLFFS